MEIKNRQRTLWKRFIPLGILIILIGAAYFLGVHHYISFETLKENRDKVLDFVYRFPILSPLIFIFFYITIVSLSLPVGSFVSVIGGFLFMQPLSTIYVLIGATTGACIVFTIAKTSLGKTLKEKAGKTFNKIERGVRENEISYLLFLRLVPIFPFWLVNIAPALLGVSFLTFFWTTLVGIAPGAFVLTQAGTALSAIFETGDEFKLSNLLNWQMKIAIFALGFFALIPIIVKKIRAKRKKP